MNDLPEVGEAAPEPEKHRLLQVRDLKYAEQLLRTARRK
jgi:hypothetical protein